MSDPLDLTGIKQVLTRATGTGWEAAYRQDVGVLLDEVTRLRTAIQRVREENDWCPVCDCYHSEPTEVCP